MATPKLQEHKDYTKWLNFYERKKHLNITKLAELAIKEFNSTSSKSTWMSRFEHIKQLYDKSKLQQHHENKDKKFLEFIGLSYPYTQKKKNFAKKIDETKIINISDPHEPYSSHVVWDEILNKHHDAYHIHVNGDIADFYSKSRFRKTDHENFNDELRAIFDRLEWLSIHWKRITLIRGNHDNRAEKRMQSLVDSDMLFLTEQDLLSYLCAFFDNIEIVGERVHSQDDKTCVVDFIWQCGDIIFTHIERSSKQSSALLDEISSQLHKWSRVFKLKPYRIIMQGHNHRCSFDTNGSEYLYICPMAASLTTAGLKYALSPALNGAPPVTGYVEIYQKNGITDINRTKIRIFEQ